MFLNNALATEQSWGRSRKREFASLHISRGNLTEPTAFVGMVATLEQHSMHLTPNPRLQCVHEPLPR